MATEVTALLRRMQDGDPSAMEELMPLVYRELRRVAQNYLRRQRPGQTLQPTALVNEAYLKLFAGTEPRFADRAHFLAVMSRVMRQVLIDRVRASAAAKRGGEKERVPWDTAVQFEAGVSPRQIRMLDLDRALSALEGENPLLARVVETHYFAGMTAEEIAVVEGRSAHAIRHDIRLARAWLRRELDTKPR
jgi:RNA polymerase sigma-70 factor, ECF subfamily